MSLFLARIARALTRHWKRSLVAALVVLFGLGAFAGAFGGMPADDFEIPGTESQRAMDLFRDHAPALAGAEANVVFTADEGAISDPANQETIRTALEEVSALPGVAEVGDPLGTVSPDGRVALVDVRYTTDISDLEASDGRALEETLRGAVESSGVGVEMRGVVIDFASEQDVPVGELIG